MIRSANAEVCRKLQNPLYEYYLKLPGAPTAGQAKIEEFHGIMLALLAEVSMCALPVYSSASLILCAYQPLLMVVISRAVVYHTRLNSSPMKNYVLANTFRRGCTAKVG